MLQECGSCESRNGAVQMFFLTPNRNMCAGKFAKSERFFAVLLEHFIVKCVEVRKMSEVFLRETVLQNEWSFPLVLFWPGEFSKIWKLKINSDDVHWNVWTNIKTLYAQNPEIKFSKKEFPIWDSESWIFWSKFPF